jgi:hypothetical protein
MNFSVMELNKIGTELKCEHNSELLREIKVSCGCSNVDPYCQLGI